MRARLERLGAGWERHPGEPLPAIFPGSAEQQAAYRFLHNKKVSSEDILQPHREALVERCRQASTVLLVQDTTTLNYTGLKASTRGLGPLQERTSSARGLFVHAAVAFTEGRRPLGVSGLETWARPETEPAAEREKESRRWFRGFDQGRALGRASPGTRVVVVGDRESDIYDLLKWQAAHADEAGLVVRASASRQRRVQVWDRQLGATMVRPLASQPDFETPVKTGRVVRIGSQGGKRARKARTAVTELCIGQVELLPPQDRPADGPVTAWVVRVLETEPPAGHAPLEWLLVSSEGSPTAAWAERIVGWYEARWGIEEYFRVLKSGTRIEDRRLREADALVKCLAFDAITAWQVCSLDRYARDAPETPAAEVLTEGRAAGDRHGGAGGRAAAAGRAWEAVSARHSQLGGAAGAHGRLASLEAKPAARQPSPVAGMRAVCGRWRASCKPRAHRRRPLGFAHSPNRHDVGGHSPRRHATRPP